MGNDSEEVMAKKVLIAEDYADIRAMMRILVQTYGYYVIEARDGSEAIEQAREHHPDFIFMDLMMPIMDGITATQIIREFKGLAEVPIVAVTAYGKSYHNKAMAAGCNEVIEKPMVFKTLEPLLNHYLN